jgi:hypothetical protein
MACSKCGKDVDIIPNRSICKECRAIYKAEWRSKNKGKIKEENAQYYRQTKDIRKVRDAQYYQNNKDAIKQRKNIYKKNRLQSDPLFRLKYSISRCIRRAVVNKRGAATIDILGCSISQFKAHLESLFEPWMSWDNYGIYTGEFNSGWDIDHIIPLSSAETEEGLIKLNHYMNLQPLCSKINRDIKRGNLWATYL